MVCASEPGMRAARPFSVSTTGWRDQVMESCRRARCRSIRLSSNGVETGEADRAAEIASQVEQPRAILQPIRRQRAERDIGDRHDRQHHAEAAQHLRHEQLPKIPVLGQIASPANC